MPESFSTFNRGSCRYLAMNFKNIFWGIILIIMGSLFLVEELTGFDFKGYFWPVILIISGALLLLRNYISSDTNHSNI
jgi:membrane-bound ClpP family serine protease